MVIVGREVVENKVVDRPNVAERNGDKKKSQKIFNMPDKSRNGKCVEGAG